MEKVRDMSEIKRQEEYAYWLSTIPQIGNRTRRKLLERYGTPAQIFMAGKNEPEHIKMCLTEKQMEKYCECLEIYDAKRYRERLDAFDIQVLWHGGPGYPRRLLDIPDAPTVLFVRGKLPDENLKHVAVIGARECSEYGSFAARMLGEKLAKTGAVVVSGLARGIDGIGQRQALLQGGSSIGILGCGPDICYPEQNKDIYEKMLSNGAILSEYPPGTKPAPRLFPARNRIISGMADVLVVVEARQKSGTFITVDMALEQGRDVWVVPGRLTDPLSVGCNELIRQGAEVITQIDQFVEKVTGIAVFQSENTKNSDGKERTPTDSLERELMCILTHDGMGADAIYMALKGRYSLPQIMWKLMKLCADGFVIQLSADCYAKIYGK